MRPLRHIIAQKWQATFGVFLMPFVIAVGSMTVGAQGPRTETPAEAAQPVSIDTTLSVADALDGRNVAFVKALGEDEIREITTDADLEIAANEVIAARLLAPAERQIAEGGKLRYVLPYRFKVSSQSINDTLNLRAVAVVERGGLRVDPETVSFGGSVRVGIENEDNPGAPPAIFANPVLFELTFSAGSVSPSDIAITHTNLPFERVALSAMEVSDVEILNIRATFDPSGEDVEIPVIPIDVLSVPEAIPGLGFGFGDVSVQLPGFLVGRITEVTLSTSRGFLRPVNVPLSESGYGHSVLRSAFLGAGEARINVERADLFFAPVKVRFFWPWILIVAILAGAGLSGGLFARTKTTGGFLLGFLIGFVAGVAICAGINLTDLRAPQFVTVAVAFVFSAIPGFSVASKIWKQR